MAFTMKAAILSIALLFHTTTGSIIQRSAASSAGCGNSHDSGYHSANDGNHQITSGGQTRKYGMWVPNGYNPQNAYSLILDFHGKGGTPEGQYGNSQYYTYSQSSNYLVAYPLGTVANDGSGENAWEGAPYASGANDIQFVNDLVNHINDNYCIDTTRIYASGKSNGGGFVDLFACDPTGDKFAAFAMAAPALYQEGVSNPSCGQKLRKIIHAHGLQDNTAPYGGKSNDQGGTLPPIATWLARWQSRDSCTSEQDTSVNGNTLMTWTSCSGGITNAIKSYKDPNGGHCWPDAQGDNTDANNNSGCGDRSLDFTSAVLDFFAARHL